MNPLEWLPNAELLGNAWNIYGVLCLLSVIIAGVIQTKRTKKPLIYRVLAVATLAWCIHLTFLDNVMIGGAVSLLMLGTVGDISWIFRIGNALVDLRPSYVVFSIAILAYFSWIDRKRPATERLLNWKSKWIWVSVLYSVATLITIYAIGWYPAPTVYPSGSVERTMLYYLGYMPTYTLWAIGAAKVFSRLKPK